MIPRSPLPPGLSAEHFMHRWIELARLPKVGRFRALNFRRTTPGTAVPYESITALKEPPLHVDPTHPASRLSHRDLERVVPWVRTSAFTLSARPKAALYVPETVWPNPPYVPAVDGRNPSESRQLDVINATGRRTRTKRGEVVDMSLLKMIGKTVHKSAVIRKKIGAKLKMALRLIVTRGASIIEQRQRKAIVFSEDDAGRKWVLEDWTYVVIPNLEVYRKPLPDLVQEMREALRKLHDKAEQLEARWGTNRVSTAKQAEVLPVNGGISKSAYLPDNIRSPAAPLSTSWLRSCENDSSLDKDSKGIWPESRRGKTPTSEEVPEPRRTLATYMEGEGDNRRCTPGRISSNSKDHPFLDEKVSQVMKALDNIIEGGEPPAPKGVSRTVPPEGDKQTLPISLGDKKLQTGSGSIPSENSIGSSGPALHKSRLKVELFNRQPIIVRRPPVNATNAEQGSVNSTSRHGRDSR